MKKVSFSGPQKAKVSDLWHLGRFSSKALKGVSYLHTIDFAGGLEVFSCYIAEDYFISKAIFKRLVTNYGMLINEFS